MASGQSSCSHGIHLFFSFFNFVILCWSIVDLQCHVGDLSWICFRTRESDETEVNKKLQCHSVMSALRQAMLANVVAC